MKYKCGKTFWESDNIGFSKNGLWNIPTEVLVDMGAVPVDSESDEKRPTGKPTWDNYPCEKCGETEGTELCPKCGAESYGNCPCKPKEEKIEIKLPNLNIKLPREILDPDSGHTEEFRHWAVQMTTSVNKLNKGDN